MSNGIRRNDPCPCGSGRKYKRCCMDGSGQEGTQPHLSPRFRFEPGSYGDVGSFIPSIACLEQTASNKWDYHFVLINPDEHHAGETLAAAQAEKDLEAAFTQKEQSGSDYGVGEYLRAKGYIRVSGFNIVKE
ncbi:MAG: SEC-C metal-binding domain-containing protein [bacterium]